MKFFKALGLIVGILAGLCSITVFFTGKHTLNEILPTKFESTDSITQHTSSDVIPQSQLEPVISNPDKSALVHRQDNFIITFLKTLVVMFTVMLGFSFTLLLGFFETIVNVFVGFENGYAWTTGLWNFVWTKVTINWFWELGQRWYLGISLFIWSVLLLSRK